MNQTFGCIIVQKEDKIFRKDKISKLLLQLNLDTITKKSESYQLKDYLLNNIIGDNEILVSEKGDKFILLGHPLYFLINKEYLGTVKHAKRTLFHFTQHGKSREYGYKFYLKGELHSHKICFGEQGDLYYKSPIKNGIPLSRSIFPDIALEDFANEKQIPLDLLDTLKRSLPRKGMSCIYFHPKKQQWVYGKQIIEIISDKVQINFQELAPQGHKRGKPITVDSNANEKGKLIKWEQLFYELHHRTISKILGFRFDFPKQFPEDLIFTKYEILNQESH